MGKYSRSSYPCFHCHHHYPYRRHPRSGRSHPIHRHRCLRITDSLRQDKLYAHNQLTLF